MTDAIDVHRAIEEPSPVPGATMVIVCNRNSFLIRDRFDGVPFTFKPNERITIPPEVATHFFGWPGDREIMNVYIAKRHGWNTREYMQRADPMDPMSELLYQRYANNIRIEVKEYVLVPREATGRAADDGVLMEDDEDRPFSQTAADPSLTHVGKRTGSKAKPQRRGGRRSAPVQAPTDPPIPLAVDLEG